MITGQLDPHAIEIARRFFAQSPHRDKIQIREGRAADTLKTLQGPFDLCFIDADKPSYDYYYDCCLELVRRGGLIVLDNMLRYGRVLNRSRRRCADRQPFPMTALKTTRASKTCCCRFATASCSHISCNARSV